MHNKPLIGVTIDSEESESVPWYNLKKTYCTAIAQAGGVPILLPHVTNAIGDYLRLIGGLVVTGGNFDIDPTLYGSTTRHQSIKTKPLRTAFEWAILEQAYQQNKAILGICGGMQLLNVILGGSLLQDIACEVPHAINHQQSATLYEPGHSANIVPETFLSRVVRQSNRLVNSSHHQAIKSLGENLLINATAPDGIIEGIEAPGRKFCLGTQWHPEYLISSGDQLIWEAFIASATT